MYEPIIKPWEQYRAKQSPQWRQDDPRHHLAAEVGARLTQLDLVLDHLGASLAIIAGDPHENRRNAEWALSAGPRLGKGEITEEEYLAGLKHKSNEQHGQFIRGFEEVRLFTEMFYLVAWRLMEVLNGSGSRAFPSVCKIKGRSIRDVRNHLIQHPEKRKPVPDYRQRLIVTDAGPVLKTSTVLVRGATGRSEPDEASVDRGLYVNAEELRGELDACLINALSS